jgi:5-methylcytosine-specific restriction enzyme A
MPYVVNVEDIETVLMELGGQARAIEIQTAVLQQFCDGRVPEQYRNERSFRMTIQRIIENHCREAAGFDPSRYAAKFRRVDHGIYRLSGVDYTRGADAIEVPPRVYIEGALKEIKVNAYERDRKARQACIDHHGTDCKVCGLNFESRYGEIGAGFIHVHHVVPLASIGEQYEVDPVKDLVPVCPNCHAMLHLGASSISDLKRRLK